MAKTAAQRITDTLTFLQNTAPGTAAERTAAYNLANGYMTAAYTATTSPQYIQFSNSLSLGYHWSGDPNRRRKMARAIFLLCKAIKHYDGAFPLPYQNVAAINQATAERILLSYMRKAGCLYQKLNGGTSATLRSYNALRANPLDFLRTNKIIIYGSGALDTTQAPLNVQSCIFAYNPGRDRYEFTVCGVLGTGAITIQVDSITAFHWTDRRYVPRPTIPAPPPLVIGATNFGQMTGIECSGNNLMLTTQFTGCAFCMAEYNGSMYCAHVSPAGISGMAPNTDGQTLATRVIVNGAFANANGTAVEVYGRNIGSAPNPNGYTIGVGYMSIVGIPGGTSYDVYSQTTNNNAIAEVRKIV